MISTLNFSGHEFQIESVDICKSHPSPDATVSVGTVGDGWDGGEFKVDFQCTVESGSFDDLWRGEPVQPRCDIRLNGSHVTTLRGALLDDSCEVPMPEALEVWMWFGMDDGTRWELELDGERFGWAPTAVDCWRVVQCES